MKLPTRSIVETAAPLALFLALVGTGCEDQRNAFQAPPPPKVTAMHPEMRLFEPYRDIVATVEPLETVEIRARISGFLESREFQPGDVVEAGAILFKLEPDEYDANLAIANADLRSAEANLKLTQQIQSKYQTAFDQGAATEIEILESEANVELASAKVEQATAKVTRTRLDVTYTTILAPIKGQIGEDLVSVGNLVGRGEPTLLAKITTIDPMNVYFSVPENSFLDFRRRMNEAGMEADAHGSVMMNAVLPDGQIYDQPGTVDFAAPEIDRNTGTVTIRGVIPNPDGLLTSGLFVRARLAEPSRKALALPQSAILIDMAGSYVFVIDKDNIVSRQGVSVGVAIDGLQEINAGLEETSMVIVDGILRARPGSAVSPDTVNLDQAMRLIDPSAPAAETNAANGDA
ncbi:MAG: efflux RND transporter periplasmic adaptor subunit [Planctomycetota bacterium]|nr:efflux RND transporter periplasmic adaptor subunit [Planctomycetota bacterium]